MVGTSSGMADHTTGIPLSDAPVSLTATGNETLHHNAFPSNDEAF